MHPFHLIALHIKRHLVQNYEQYKPYIFPPLIYPKIFIPIKP